jgi:hypothetical protein
MGSDEERVAPPSGPRPQPFTWPFELAAQAIAAIEAEIEELGACSTTHDGLLGGLLPQWVGRSCEEFTSGLEEGLHTLATRRGQLETDLEDLRDAVRRAEEARDRRSADIAAWDRQMRAFERSVAPGGPVPR